MDFRKLISRYWQFGGLCLVWQYSKLGVLPVVIKGVVRCVLKGQSYKAIYPEVQKRVKPMLIERYQVSRFKIQANGLSHEHPKVIWWCWLQGKEQAPYIVQACYNSLKRNLPEYEIRVIDAENWKEYIELPDYIVKKWEKKQIPSALFSDLLRLQLLIKYGGTWIDSTVFCTGFNGSKVDPPVEPAHARETESKLSSPLAQSQPSSAQKYLDADLFLFQYTPEGTTNNISISNWFISAHSNNEILMTLKDMLFAYWKDYNCTLDYYIFHLFFSMIAKEYPEQIAAMPYGQSQNSLVQLHHWGEKFDQKKWDKLTSRVCFHKLAFRVSGNVTKDKENYYNYILTEYGRI